MESKGDLYVGIFFFAGLAIMLVLAIRVKPDLFQGKSYNRYQAKFSSVSSLKVGDPVMLAGQRVGNIHNVDASEATHVAIQFEVEKRFNILKGTSVKISADSILGGGKLTLGQPRTSDVRKKIQKLEYRKRTLLDLLNREGKLPTQESEELDRLVGKDSAKGEIAAMRELLETMNDPLQGDELIVVLEGGDMNEAFEQVAAGFREVKITLQDAREPEGLITKFRDAAAGIDTLMASINDKEGKGTLPRLIHDADLATNVAETVDNIKVAFDGVKKFVENAQKEDGLVSTVQGAFQDVRDFMKSAQEDDGLVTTVTEAFAEVREVAKSAQSEDSAIGRLLNHKETREKMDEIIENIRDVTKQVSNKGKPGLVARLLYDEELADNVGSTVRDVKDMVAKVKKGEGTLGQIVMSDEIADNLNRLLKGAGDAIEDAREQAPISAFGATLLGGIQ